MPPRIRQLNVGFVSVSVVEWLVILVPHATALALYWPDTGVSVVEWLVILVPQAMWLFWRGCRGCFSC